MSNSSEISDASNAVIESAKWINNILITGSVLAITAIVTKCSAGSLLKIPETEISISTNWLWVVFAVFTAAHFYATDMFKQACDRLFFNDFKNAEPTWSKLTGHGPLFFRGMKPRLLPARPEGKAETTSAVAPIDPSDRTSLVHHGAAILLFAAMLPFDPVVVGLGATLVLVCLNWSLGSSWAIAASELTLKPGQTQHLKQPKPDVATHATRDSEPGVF